MFNYSLILLCLIFAWGGCNRHQTAPLLSPQATENDVVEPFGLPNLGNTCFSNAGIQAFLGSTRKEILNGTYESGSILGVLKKMLESKDHESKVEFINKTLSHLGCPIGVQRDSFNFFIDFLKAIAQEDPVLVSNWELKQRLTSYSCGNKVEVDKSKYALRDLNYVVYTSRDNVQEGINAQLYQVLMSSECGDGCNEKCVKIVTFDWPKNLIIRIPVGGIGGDAALFPSGELLIDGKFSRDKKEKKYKLSSIVVHRGTAAGGHYFAFVKYGNNWFECNDSLVRPVDEKKVLSTEIFHYSVYTLQQ